MKVIYIMLVVFILGVVLKLFVPQLPGWVYYIGLIPITWWALTVLLTWKSKKQRELEDWLKDD